MTTDSPRAMSDLFKVDYLSAGGNRNSAAADWSLDSNVLAYGADQNIALWLPLSDDGPGLSALISGHNAKVTALRFAHAGPPLENDQVIVSGDADGHLRITTVSMLKDGGWPYVGKWQCVGEVKAHEGTVNTISCLDKSSIFVTGGADALIKIWRRRSDGLDLIHTISTKPRFIPLSSSIGWFERSKTNDAAFIAVAGTRNDIHVYSAENLLKDSPVVKHSATLAGHEGWIRSLALTSADSDGSYMLASASADKYVRLWKFAEGEGESATVADAAESGIHQTTLAPKLQTVACSDAQYTITFEALLLGHEDWVYSAAWSPKAGQRQLLTASADGSLTIWEADPVSGVWYSASRLGEISGQKGATTATGSSGGFWTGLWSPDGATVTCLGRTGSWRLWQYDGELHYWTQRHGVSGHVGSVNDLAWPQNEAYLLSTGSDQTTRLHAEWRRGTKRTWHEFARPQIHGYDLNCVSSILPTRFVSGADEKLLRVFDAPKAIANMLERLCRLVVPDRDTLPSIAAIPVLGLSNKAEADGEKDGDAGAATAAAAAAADEEGETKVDDGTGKFDELVAPPTEDLLSRHTLFPEHEKLYGHGYEISTSAASSTFRVVATACKASSLDHAVIRLYSTRTWREIKPPLQAHTLTITRLAWSEGPDNYLLSVGRDRQWCVYTRERGGEPEFNVHESVEDLGTTEWTWRTKQLQAQAHARMILDCAWSRVAGCAFFATAGRDRRIKIWTRDGPADLYDIDFAQTLEIRRPSAVTAVDFTCDLSLKYSVLAAGEEDGSVSLHVINTSDPSKLLRTVELPRHLCPSRAVNRLAWRHELSCWADDAARAETHLAVASADGSVRVFLVQTGALVLDVGAELGDDLGEDGVADASTSAN